eukprot:1978597-Pyramimonas_sp.AAC.1
METGYFDQPIPMTAPQQENLPNTPPASIPPTHYEPGVGQVAPPMSPRGGGGTELPIDPEQLRELRARRFQTQMENAHTTFMLDADNPESELFDLSDSSVVTAATAVRAVELSATNYEFDERLQYRDHLTNEGLQDITLH